MTDEEKRGSSGTAPQSFRHDGKTYRFNQMDNETWAEFLDWDEAQMREKESNSLGFRTAVGGLMWVVGGVCPHCFAPVMMLARFLATHRSWHYKQALQIIRYLYINRDVLVIRYTRQEDPTLNNTIFGFVDADWSSGYSRGGYIFTMNGGPIDWVSRLFRCTAQSSTEAEYMALCDCVNQGHYLLHLQRETVRKDKAIPRNYR